MNFSDDLRLDVSEFKQKIDNYFSEVTREELVNDLEELGCIVEEIDDSTMLGDYLAETVEVVDDDHYIINNGQSQFSSNNKGNLWELDAA